MIIGIGTDLVQIKRISQTLETFGPRFEEKIFTPDEILKAKTLPAPKRPAFYAKRFAAKEAFAKALGSGIGLNAFFKEIEVKNNDKGAPFFVLHGRAKDSLYHLGGASATIHLSLSDEKEFATAFVVIEK